MKSSFILLAAVLALSSSFAQGKKPVFNFNPIIPDNIADPSLVMFNDTFYLYATTDIDHGLAKGGPPVVWKSTDFVNWSFQGILQTGIDWDKTHVYTNEKGEKRKGYFRYWAPGKPIERNGKYYLFPTIVTPNDQTATYAMEADHPLGPFHFINGQGLAFPANPATDAKPIVDDIDGEPFIDDDGRTYIYWRRRFAVEVSNDLQKQLGNTVSIPTLHQGYSEGPVGFKRNGIYYYVYTLSGHASYANGYMMSKKGPLEGFESPKGKNVFVRSNTATGVWGPGHGNVFQVPDKDEFIFLYLEYGEGGTTRQVFANRIQFNEDGTLQPVKPDFKGIGYLGKKSSRAPKNLFSTAKVTASGYRLNKTVKGEIAPDPDLALETKGLPTMKVERTATYLPQNAADASNGTRWFANENDPNPWIQFDLGKVKKLNTIEMFFVFPSYGHTWHMEKSNDGKTWVPCAAQKELAIQSPHITKNIGKARFIRIYIDKGEKGIWEVKGR